MKSTRSSSVGASASRRRSTTSERRNNNEQTPTLRRSSRDRDAASPASPKSLRSRRRATSAEESLNIIRTPTPIRRDHEGRRSRNNRHPPKMVSGTTTTGDIGSGSDVLVADMEGTLVRVHLTVNGSRSSSSEQQGTTTKKHAPTFLGQDGNLFNCMVCREFGDVVCCDGCPHVYHPHCIPVGSPSRISLDNDEDPWFCPRDN
ncbi:DDT domain [Seminavis robusta]|uniref:DDT domain n=1 Tax=Seminavis robusta TaxID=568900 RepID=A0A9N8HYI9_9STRA|nr:DDT domain [Seminavis robusta]|eukprot:Sro4251_g353520.1 DDT domain (203) ;mRNA; f:1474-2082